MSDFLVGTWELSKKDVEGGTVMDSVLSLLVPQTFTLNSDYTAKVSIIPVAGLTWKWDGVNLNIYDSKGTLKNSWPAVRLGSELSITIESNGYKVIAHYKKV